ncbi:MAG: type II toxin-antitoxin system YoeB family toxin [Candidatus Pacearchaeota archaeon]|jgi:Txe/YoeB family toxin of Txe-Axe toxin-antitoxin module
MKEVKVAFIDKKLKESFDKLKKEKTSEKDLSEFLERAIKDIKKNPFVGIQIKKKLIPKEYRTKYQIQNLWKYNLPNAWRLIYSIQKDHISIVCVLLEWFSHKKYERRFKF